ncbi:DUF4129 domain-containing protein [Haloarcula salinisoli]|uniref:DUF4129 domain-containing protein n=1 Tax=Haloarcula salinisoli TaxID=2487746 RepID=A0A8J8CB65_9EURY|nr:DUF4129 domain-containing protein [Halomicroarcula salinisoli]MBX0286431.1 DUF4129 domain-containing protein [Halomicroarcula salinisoli]MBX0302080.1 DUF4129 domain-containing protein [Halomicroarcula salinisoli]
MERVIPLALAVLAVFALATVASSLDTVSTEPAIESDTTPTADTNGSPGVPSGNRTGTEIGDTRTPTELTATPASGAATGPPLWQVVAGLALFLVGSVAALYGLTRGEDDDTDDEPATPEPTAPAADRATLGADVPATNDVYRAWAALCRAVPLDPAGQTPAEVAEAAVATGYGAETVAELTDSFCAIRYGDAAPTGERERRARALATELSLPLEGEP